eukprot:scaffold1048_cov90-Amphora_coffeaeformis.AAC.4
MHVVLSLLVFDGEGGAGFLATDDDPWCAYRDEVSLACDSKFLATNELFVEKDERPPAARFVPRTATSMKEYG